MRNRRQLLTDHQPIAEVWPAFTDVMSTMAMILFVLVLLAFVRTLIDGKRLAAFSRQISASELRLRALSDELRRTSADVDASRRQLRLQEGVIAHSNEQLDALRARLQGIAVLRVEVLNKLKTAIESELGSTSRSGGALVTIGSNGNVVINESLVFESGSYAIKPDGRPLLDALGRALKKLLTEEEVRNTIDTILIQGHTDERGSPSYNWDLSAKRATAVLNYLFETDPALKGSYAGFFAASAYSKFRPVDASKTEEAYRRNRRIEISIVPRDASIHQVIDDYLKSIAPTPQ